VSDPVPRLNAALEHRYRIERELGAGGMATVHLADDLKHERKVALKVLKPELAAVVGAERFLAEIKTTANLQHPHILPLFDSGEADGFLFYAMPLIEGESLRARLDREHQLPVEEALRIATAVAHALDYAHRHGVIHRDIKPANILIHDGEPVVSDFGIALAVDAAGGDRLTETGLSMGTPHYMSPEQAAGDGGVGPWSDVYALGCVLYEMLVGEPPYTGRTAQAILAKIITADADSVREHRKAVPPNVDAAVAKALEKLPADRFASASDFATALTRPGFRHDTVGAPEHPHVGRYAAAGALAGALATLAIGAALIGGDSTPAVRFGTVTKVTFDAGLEILPAISPDGRDVAYVWVGGSGASRVMVRGVAGGTAAAVAAESSGDEIYPAWSPDRTSLSFHGSGQVFVVPTRGGVPRPVAPVGEGAQARFAAWSPEGDRIAYIRADAEGTYLVVRELQGEERQLAAASDAHGLAWSPDGRFIAYVQGNSLWVRPVSSFGNVAPSQIWVAPVDGGEPVPVTTLEHLNVSPAWLPDGRLLFVSSRGGARDVYMIALDEAGRPRGDLVRVTVGLDPHTISASVDGTRIAYSVLGRSQNIHSLTIPATGPVSAYESGSVTVGQQVIEGMAISPDGQWIAFDSDRSGNQDAYRRRLSGGEPLQLAPSPENEFVRSWGGDGSWVVGHGFNEGNRDIYLLDAEGLGISYPMPLPGEQRYPDMSPDGARIVYQSGPAAGSNGALYEIERDGAGGWTEPRRLSPDPGYVGRYSPDGSQIAYANGAGVWLAGSDPDEPQVVWRPTDSGTTVTNVEWYAGGTRLLFLRRFPDGTSTLWSVALDGSDPRELMRFGDAGRQPRSEMAVHDDIVYFTIGEFESDVWVMDVEWD
jgi:serine/threonine-protein kinase